MLLHFVRQLILLTKLLIPISILLGSGLNLSVAEDVDDDNLILVMPGRQLTVKQRSTATGIMYSAPFIDAQGNHIDPLEPTDQDLANAAKVKHLRRIILYGDAITAEGMWHLARHNSLKSVSYGNMKNSKELLKVLSTCRTLEKLEIPNSDITNEASEFVSKFGKLRHLDLSNTKVDITFFQSHALPSQLTQLKLDGTLVDSNVLKFVPQSVTHLSLSETRVDRTAVPLLAKRTNLKVLVLPTEHFPASVRSRVREQLPNTKINEIGLPLF